jgi:hypothetical protein
MIVAHDQPDYIIKNIPPVLQFVSAKGAWRTEWQMTGHKKSPP